MSCCSEQVPQLIPEFGDSVLSLLLTLFMTGLAGSLTHCIGMCGPIAVGQMSMRLMHLPQDQISQKNKIMCAASFPYYIGKAISYALMAMLWFLMSSFLMRYTIFRFIGASFMVGAALFFLFSALPPIPTIKSLSLNINQIFSRLVLKTTNHLKYDLSGPRGWIFGMVLGLIPCGLVYSSIITAVTYSDNFIIAGVSLFLFGLGTIPGLVMISYLGEHILIRWRKLFGMIYTISMYFNAYLLAIAAIRFIS